jgi:DNA polymerase-4
VVEERGLTLVGIAVTNLGRDDAIQLALSFDPRFDDLDAALDVVRDRFGTSAVTRAVLLGRSPGVVMPVLPD